MLASAGKWLIIGLIFGLWLSAAVANALRSLLLGVSPLDPAAWAFSAAILLTAALAAAWFPSRRASAIDPMQVLRHE